METRLTAVGPHRVPTTGRAIPNVPVRVLLVEGQDAYRASVARLLRRAGYEMETVATGFEALAVASATPFDVLVTDFELPRMRGQELARRLRARHPALKVLFLIADGQTSRLYSNYELRRDDEVFLDKPSKAQGVLDALSAVVSGQPLAELIPA